MPFLSWLFDRRRSCAECSLNERQNALLLDQRCDMAGQLVRLEWEMAAARAAASETELVRGFLAEQRSTFEARVNELTGLLARERRWNEELRTELRLTRGNVFHMLQGVGSPRTEVLFYQDVSSEMSAEEKKDYEEHLSEIERMKERNKGLMTAREYYREEAEKTGGEDFDARVARHINETERLRD